ncbi:hypothetical protein BaRGS_00028060 [Batillaria attramentaria]|uniref:Uncharacterized protein n=1 Tax=Batillaria attramentaria TaxID=370345 RepID=A0ABD0K1G0_9CAEN
MASKRSVSPTQHDYLTHPKHNRRQLCSGWYIYYTIRLWPAFRNQEPCTPHLPYCGLYKFPHKDCTNSAPTNLVWLLEIKYLAGRMHFWLLILEDMSDSAGKGSSGCQAKDSTGMLLLAMLQSFPNDYFKFKASDQRAISEKPQPLIFATCKHSSHLVPL